MNDKNVKKIARREFMKNSATGAVVGLSAMAMAKEAIAQAERVGRPVLTDAALSGLFAGPRAAAMAAEAKKDIKGFIIRRFTLTPVQSSQLEALSPAQLASFSHLLEVVETSGSALNVKFPNPTGADSLARKKCEKLEITFTFTF